METLKKHPGLHDVQPAEKGPYKLYCAAGIGGLLLGLADLTKNEGALVARVAEMLGRLFHAASLVEYGPLVALLLLAVVACASCWIFEPKTKVDAFARGLSVFALLNLTPAPPQDAGDATASLSERVSMQRVGPMASFVHMRALPAARVQDPVELFIKLDVKGDLSETASMVTVRDLQTARLLYRDSRKGDRFVFPVSPGLRVRVEIEVPGHRRAKFDVEIDSQGPKAFCVELEPSSIPLGLQQLYGFQTVEPKPDCSVQSGSGDNAGGGVTT